jgi:iron(III) transport system substrate-binding protein
MDGKNMSKESRLFPCNLGAPKFLALLLLVWQILGGTDAVVAGEAWLGGGDTDWAKIVEAAKQEGQVTIYGTRGYQLIVDEGIFQKAYPGVKVVTFSSSTSAFMQRLLAERRAGKNLADITIAGGDSLSVLYESKYLKPLAPSLVLPEVLDQSKWWKQKHYFIDPERKYVFQYIGSPQFGSICYNSKLFNPEGVSSFWDFLNPKWKAKIEAGDIREGGSGNAAIRFYYYNRKLGPEFIKRLYGEMGVTLFRDSRQSVDWLANGKFAICFFCVSSEIGRATKQGLPIDTFDRLLKEGAALAGQSGTVGLTADGPNPNAAKVFLNWLLSREGQMTMQKAYVKAGVGASNSLRTDIPKDIVPADQRLRDDVDYFEIELAETRDMRPVLEVFEAALRNAEKKR